jgi:hypothetical protein
VNDVAPIAREVTTWEEAGWLCSRVATNADMDRFRARLRERGLEDYVQAVEGHFDRTRVNGGNAFLILWRPGTTRADVSPGLQGL